MDQKTACVYKITNLINNKVYIGKTILFPREKRLKYHLQIAKHKYKRTYSYIHKAMNKYGFENFKFEVIEECISETEALVRESFYIKEYNSKNSEFGYNLTDGGDGISGYKYLEEDLEALRIRASNRKEKLKGAGNPFYGKKHSEETKKIISEKRKNASKENYIGEKSSQSKFTNEQVEKILISYYFELKSTGEISKELNIKDSGIKSIIIGDTWSHIRPDIIRKPRTNKEASDLQFEKTHGKLIKHNLVCKLCNADFIFEKRELEKKNLPKYCSQKCLYSRYKTKALD